MHRIDPRIVIIQIALSGICAFWIFKPLAMLCEVIFLMSFLLYLQHPKEALRLGVWFAFLVGLYALLNESNAPQIIVQPVFLLRKLSPLLGVMVLSLKALTVSELFMGLQKLHCPKSATLALAVALRFIPTIHHELEQIRNGMKTRGVPLNVITFVKAPAMTTEYMIIPFIMRCIKVADELSAAAVTRAIENPVPRGMRVNFLENYSMHILDRVTTGMVNMVVISIFILMFDWRLGVIFILGVLCSFLIYGRMQGKGEELTAKQRQVQAASVEATLEYVQGISVIKSFNMAEKNLSGIEKAYEKSMEASYALERDFAPMNVAYSMVFRVAACAIILVSQIFALGGELDFSSLAVILIASFSIFNSVEVMGQMTAMIRSMEASLDRVERIKGETVAKSFASMHANALWKA